MKILIINLTRFGDLLQTQPVITGLAEQGHEVGLACLEQFASATDLLTDVSFVAPFIGSSLLRSLDEDWPQAINLLHAWRQKINTTFNPELVINLTSSLSARMLTLYLTKSDKNPENSIPFAGFALDEFGFMLDSNAWGTYLQASSLNRDNSPYNLIDIFRKICDLGEAWPKYNLRELDADRQKEVENKLLPAAKQAIQAKCDTANLKLKGFIGFQLGASDDRRRWPTGYFAQLGDLLWQNFGLLPLILGSKAEESLGEKYTQKTKSPYLDLLGATDLLGLASVLGLCKILVTNDTGTMHLAAGLKIPTLAIFLGTAQPWDTVAYHEGICALEPDLFDHPRPFNNLCLPGCACRTTIKPETVFNLMSGYFKTGDWNKLEPVSSSENTRVWVTCRNSKDIDSEGFLDLKSLSGHEQAERTFWLRLQRYFLRKYLDKKLEEIELPQIPFDLEAGKLALSNQFITQVRNELEQSGALLHLMKEQGAALSVSPIPLLKNRFMATWQRLQTLWDNSKYLKVLSLLWLAETQKHGDNMEQVLKLASDYEKLCKLWRQSLN